jgi:hypothetical protein
VVCRYLYDNDFTGPLPTELGTLDALQQLCVRLPHPPRLHACAVTGLSAAVALGCRFLSTNSITGTLPTELGKLTAVANLCVRRPHPPCLDTCAVTGLWAERGGGVGMQGAGREQSHGGTAHRAGHYGRAAQPVRAQPSPTAWRRAPSPSCKLSAAAWGCAGI